MSSPKRLARIAGLLYLIVGIFGGFAILDRDVNAAINILQRGLQTLQT